MDFPDYLVLEVLVVAIVILVQQVMQVGEGNIVGHGQADNSY